MEFKHELDNECAFHVESNEGFCSPKELVDKLKKFSETRDDKLDKVKKTSLEILKAKYNCDSETCILNQYDVKRYVDPNMIERALKENFKPIGPRMNKDWLSNFNIDEVLRQIQKKYKDKHFFHVPYQMRDFEKTNSELANLDWESKYKRGYRTFGTVMNTDYSDGNGIHWFAIFGDFLDDNKCYTIEYFNSSGELPLPEVSSWMKRFKHSLNLDKPVKDIVVTRIENQKSTSECGLYSLYYIISRLDGIPMEWFKKNRVKDSTMYTFRQYLFREEK